MDGMAVATRGRAGNSRIVVYNARGMFIRRFGTAGMKDGEFVQPCALAVDAKDWVYVADSGTHKIQVQQHLNASSGVFSWREFLECGPSMSSFRVSVVGCNRAPSKSLY